jgi:hypothetical protein
MSARLPIPTRGQGLSSSIAPAALGPLSPAPGRRSQFAERRANARAAWIELLDWAAAFGQAVVEGGEPDPVDRRELEGALRKAPAFPLPYASAAAAAAGFRDLTHGFVTAEVPELREALAAAMAAAARCCRRMIQLDDEQEAAADRRRRAED